MLEEERRRIGVDVGHRTGRDGEVPMLADRATEQVSLERVGRLLVERQQIRDRVPAHDARHRRDVDQRRQGGEQTAA